MRDWSDRMDDASYTLTNATKATFSYFDDYRLHLRQMFVTELTKTILKETKCQWHLLLHETEI
jgi:hypothetical protein